MTVKELQKAIRQATNEVNARIISYRDSNEENKGYEANITRLRKAGTSKADRAKGRTAMGAKGEVGLGLRGKRKSDLENQLMQLESFIRFDMKSDEAKDKQIKRAQEAYEAFKQNYGYISRDDYDEFVLLLNAIGDDLINFYRSLEGQGMLEVYKEAGRGNTADLISKMKKIKKQLELKAKTDTVDTQDYANLLRQELGMD